MALQWHVASPMPLWIGVGAYFLGVTVIVAVSPGGATVKVTGRLVEEGCIWNREAQPGCKTAAAAVVVVAPDSLGSAGILVAIRF